jgi:hypothetical protein
MAIPGARVEATVKKWGNRRPAWRRPGCVACGVTPTLARGAGPAGADSGAAWWTAGGTPGPRSWPVARALPWLGHRPLANGVPSQASRLTESRPGLQRETEAHRHRRPSQAGAGLAADHPPSGFIPSPSAGPSLEDIKGDPLEMCDFSGSRLQPPPSSASPPHSLLRFPAQCQREGWGHGGQRERGKKKSSCCLPTCGTVFILSRKVESDLFP